MSRWRENSVVAYISRSLKPSKRNSQVTLTGKTSRLSLWYEVHGRDRGQFARQGARQSAQCQKRDYDKARHFVLKPDALVSIRHVGL